MIELRFPDDLYDGFAVDEAVKTYADYASAELAREDGAYVVRVTAKPDAGFDDRAIALELANFALGRSIDRHEHGGAA